MKGTTNCADSLLHACEPQTGSFVTDIEANPIVDYPKQDSPIFGCKLYLHVLGLAMLGDVMQRFLRDTIQSKRS